MADKRGREWGDSSSETETESDSGDTHSRNKDQKQTKKKKKYKTRYSKEWEKTYLKNCSTHVSEKEYKFHCSCCNSNLSCAEGGINDVAKHASKELRLIST